MRQARFHSTTGGVVAGLVILLAAVACSRVATAGDPDGPGSGHHSNSYQFIVGPVVTPPDAMISTPHFPVPVSFLGDPDNPTGRGTKNSGDPDSPMGKKNGAPGQILSLKVERISRSEVRIHVAFLGDPDGPTGQTTQGYHDVDGGYRLNAYDVMGRLRHQWKVEEVLANGGQVGWNMTDDQGLRLAAGIYFVRFQGGGSAITQPVLALH